MTRIVFARHGESEWHRADRYVGSSDIDLTARGRDQARELGAWAAGQDLSALWSSPLRRCRDTAQAVATATGLEVRVEARLQELDFGIAEGVTRADLEREHPLAYAAFVTDPVGHHFPGGDDPRVAARGFVAALRDIAAGHPHERVLVVAHATVLRLALCDLLGVPLSSYRSTFPRLTNGSVSEIEVSDAESSPSRGVGLLALNVPLGASGDAA